VICPLWSLLTNAPAQQTMHRIFRIAYAPDCPVFSHSPSIRTTPPGGAIFFGNTAEKFEEADAFKFLAVEAK